MWDELLLMMMENQEKAVASNAQKSEEETTNVDEMGRMERNGIRFEYQSL